MSDTIEKLGKSVAVLEHQVESLERRIDKYDEILQAITKSNELLSGKIIYLETQEDHHTKQLESLSQNNKLQTKLLMAIVTASAGTLVSLVLKSLGAMQ